MLQEQAYIKAWEGRQNQRKLKRPSITALGSAFTLLQLISHKRALGGFLALHNKLVEHHHDSIDRHQTTYIFAFGVCSNTLIFGSQRLCSMR